MPITWAASSKVLEVSLLAGIKSELTLMIALGVDNIIQTIIGQGAVFGGAGSYPLEGGYIYFTPVGECYQSFLSLVAKHV